MLLLFLPSHALPFQTEGNSRFSFRESSGVQWRDLQVLIMGDPVVSVEIADVIAGRTTIPNMPINLVREEFTFRLVPITSLDFLRVYHRMEVLHVIVVDALAHQNIVPVVKLWLRDTLGAKYRVFFIINSDGKADVERDVKGALRGARATALFFSTACSDMEVRSAFQNVVSNTQLYPQVPYCCVAFKDLLFSMRAATPIMSSLQLKKLGEASEVMTDFSGLLTFLHDRGCILYCPNNAVLASHVIVSGDFLAIHLETLLRFGFPNGSAPISSLTTLWKTSALLTQVVVRALSELVRGF